MIPALRNEKAIEVGRFVRASVAAAGGAATADLDDVFQEAVLWALEWADRYGGGFEGNPFTPMASVAFRRASLAAARARHAPSITEHGLRTGWGIWPTVPIADCGSDTEDDGGRPAVQIAAPASWAPGVRLATEQSRHRRVARLLGDLDRNEQRLVRLALAGEGTALRRLASRCGLKPPRARQILRRLAAALGNDPAVAAVRQLARDERLPSPGTTLVGRVARSRAVTCLVLEYGFEYDGRRFSSLSAAAAEASRDLGRPRVAINGFEFWGLAGGRRVLSRAWQRRKSTYRRTRAGASRPNRRTKTCAPSATSQSPKGRARSTAQHPASTSESPAIAVFRR